MPLLADVTAKLASTPPNPIPSTLKACCQTPKSAYGSALAGFAELSIGSKVSTSSKLSYFWAKTN